MSVFIKGMEMPKNCMECPFRNIGVDSYICFCPGVDGRKYYEFWYGEICIPDDCPLVEVHVPHGRLIDGDVLWDAMSKYNDNEGAKMPFGYDDMSIHIDSACFVIENAPTVIEAEGEEHEE